MKKLLVFAAAASLAGYTALGQGAYNTGISVEDGTAKVGQNYDLAEDGFNQSYDLIGTKVAETVGSFGNFGGGLHVNWDASGIYIGIENGSTGGNNNYMIFADFGSGTGVASLAGLGDSTGAGLGAADFDHLDNSENLSFGGGFLPEVAILAGDEWGDQDTFSSFGRPGIALFGGSGDTGQGIVDLANSLPGGAFSTIGGSDLTQFEAAVQAGDDVDGNQNAEYIEAFIPASFLTGIGFSLTPGATLQVAAIVAGGDAGGGSPTTFFSTAYVGAGTSVIPGTGAANTLDGLGVTLGAVPEPSTFSLLAISLMSFAAIRRKIR